MGASKQQQLHRQEYCEGKAPAGRNLDSSIIYKKNINIKCKLRGFANPDLILCSSIERVAIGDMVGITPGHSGREEEKESSLHLHSFDSLASVPPWSCSRKLLSVA